MALSRWAVHQFLLSPFIENACTRPARVTSTRMLAVAGERSLMRDGDREGRSVVMRFGRNRSRFDVEAQGLEEPGETQAEGSRLLRPRPSLRAMSALSALEGPPWVRVSV